jgi:hypothetical protein
MGYLLTTQKQYQQVKKLTFSGTGGEAPPAASARTNKDFYANYATESLALSDLANGIILRVEASLAGAYTIVIFGHTQKGEMEQLFSFTATCAATNTVSDDGNYIAQTVARTVRWKRRYLRWGSDRGTGSNQIRRNRLRTYHCDRRNRLRTYHCDC